MFRTKGESFDLEALDRQMVRYYGYYSNVSRGKRKKQDLDDIIPSILEPIGSSKALRKNWARLIQKIYETDPLCCPKCSGKMKILSFIEDPEVTRPPRLKAKPTRLPAPEAQLMAGRWRAGQENPQALRTVGYQGQTSTQSHRNSTRFPDRLLPPGRRPYGPEADSQVPPCEDHLYPVEFPEGNTIQLGLQRS